LDSEIIINSSFILHRLGFQWAWSCNFSFCNFTWFFDHYNLPSSLIPSRASITPSLFISRSVIPIVFLTVNSFLILPVFATIKLLVSSVDVIHSFGMASELAPHLINLWFYLYSVCAALLELILAAVDFSMISVFVFMIRSDDFLERISRTVSFALTNLSGLKRVSLLNPFSAFRSFRLILVSLVQILLLSLSFQYLLNSWLQFIPNLLIMLFFCLTFFLFYFPLALNCFVIVLLNLPYWFLLFILLL